MWRVLDLALMLNECCMVVSLVKMENGQYKESMMNLDCILAGIWYTIRGQSCRKGRNVVKIMVSPVNKMVILIGNQTSLSDRKTTISNSPSTKEELPW